MNAIEEGIAENWRPMVQAAGMYSPQQDAATLFLLAGFLMRDPVVEARAHKKYSAFRWSEEQPIAKDVHVSVLQEMSERDKEALRRRIIKATAAMRQG